MRDTHPPEEGTLLDRAFATGALATIATGGALLGLGIREGEPGRVFRLAGRALLERFGVASAAAPLTSVTLGYVHHLAIATLWGALLGLLVLPFRGALRIVMAICVTILHGWLALQLLPPMLRIGAVVTSNGFSVVAVSVALGVALLGGIWLAKDSTTGSLE